MCVGVGGKLFILACAYVYIPVLGRNKGKGVFNVYGNLLNTWPILFFYELIYFRT